MTTEPTVSDIYYKLGGLEGKLDAALSALGKELSSASARLDHHEDRIVSLEKRNARMGGIFVFLPPLVSIIVGAAAALLARHLP